VKGHILLEGGAEFGGQMSAPDLRAIELAGGLGASLSILPTAAAPDNNHARAGANGLRWFRGLGATNLSVVPLIDRASANQADVVEALKLSRLVYLLGGFPGYTCRTLAGSLGWDAVLEAYAAGAVVGGSSAGAMVLCQYLYDPENRSVVGGLNLLPNTCVIPHHNTFGKGWVPHLAAALPGAALIGIDEQTGLIDDAPGGGWTVYGRGAVAIYKSGALTIYRSGEVFSF
jgi:cyanophycinase